MKLRATTCMLLASVALSLSACGESVSEFVGDEGSESGDAAVQGGESLDTYIEAYNKLIGTFGFTENAEKYREADIANKSASDRIYVNGSGWIDQGIDLLKEARAMSGGDAELDAAADKLIASMQKAATRLDALESYYDSKKYTEDSFARGKEEDPLMLAELDAAEADLSAFNAVLSDLIRQRDLATIEQLKADGDELGYSVKMAFFKSSEMMDVLIEADSPSDPAVLAKADALMAEVEQAIEGGKSAASAAGEDEPHGLGELESMIGAYREFKQSGDVGRLEYALDRYNSAVHSANTFG